MHVHEKYNTSLPEVIFENQKVENSPESKKLAVKSSPEITITYGHSRDHRPDLKQFIIEMICSGDGDIPIFLKLASGNQADSSCFGKIVVKYQQQLEVNSLIVADCALHTESNLKMMSDLRWLCRVPLSIKAAKSLISKTYATSTLVRCVRYQEPVYLHDLYCLTHPTSDFWCDACVSPNINSIDF